MPEEEWINIGITLSVPNEKLEGFRGLLQPYADELGWNLSAGNDDSEGKKAKLSLAPAAGRISPRELKENLNRIAGIGFAILKDIIHMGDREKALQNYMQGLVLTAARSPESKKEMIFMGHTVGFLWFNYDIARRIMLEKENKELALALFFNQTAEEQLKEFFQSKKPEEQDRKLKEALEKKYGFKL